MGQEEAKWTLAKCTRIAERQRRMAASLVFMGLSIMWKTTLAKSCKNSSSGCARPQTLLSSTSSRVTSAVSSFSFSSLDDHAAAVLDTAPFFPRAFFFTGS